MARRCQFTGKGTRFGKSRSHSMIGTNRTYKANILKKRIDLGDGVKVTVKISAKAYKKLKGLI